jgi:hypothetical protein
LTGAARVSILMVSRLDIPCEVPLSPVSCTHFAQLKLVRILILAAICSSVLVLTAGCIFSPSRDDHKVVDDGPYDPPTNPLNVLANLQRAYKNRDSVYVKDIYDTTYVGTSTDLSDPNPDTQLSTFRWADEIAHVAALARSTTISSVDLDFGPQTSWTVINSDDPSHPEWAEMQINSWKVDIYDASTEYIVESKNPTTFYFIPLLSGSGETTWKIVKWVEVGASI